MPRVRTDHPRVREWIVKGVVDERERREWVEEGGGVAHGALREAAHRLGCGDREVRRAIQEAGWKGREVERVNDEKGKRRAEWAERVAQTAYARMTEDVRGRRRQETAGVREAWRFAWALAANYVLTCAVLAWTGWMAGGLLGRMGGVDEAGEGTYRWSGVAVGLTVGVAVEGWLAVVRTGSWLKGRRE
ncbi:hypothetical protein CDCA_CDCA03G1059 [Cyanidium caldarium]|uniref:Uncharacterized protein n=1 Tax=Cyanidium caldarium TaxID=2771 RepID=A0AAV9IRV2_CYACA|nr:hypothetical protein CDCA_CDCA03G1059 [Cyanidium caldarium]